MEDLWDLIASGNKKAITEKGLSRLLTHVKSGTGFAIISADRGDKTPEENNKRRLALQAFLSSKSVGFTRVKGGWIEKDPEGNRKAVHEQSYFLPEVSKDFAIALAKFVGTKFDQDGILWGEADTGVFIVDRNGTMSKIGSSINISSMSDYFTQVKVGKHKSALAKSGSRFTFEYLYPIPATMIEYIQFKQELQSLRESCAQTATRILKESRK